MKTSIIEVGGLLSVLSARGVEKQLARLPGVTKVEVNYVAGSATVEYDEARADLKTIKARVHKCGYHCRGELAPKHVCEPEDPPAEAAAMAPPDRLATRPHEEHEAHREAGARADETAHEMGHGGGMDMQAMVLKRTRLPGLQRDTPVPGPDSGGIAAASCGARAHAA